MPPNSQAPSHPRMAQSGQIILWSVHPGRSPETAVDATSAFLPHPAPTPDLHSTPAHPFRKLDLLVSQKTSMANVPVLRPDVHSWAPPQLPAVSAGTSGPRGRGPAGDLQSLVSQVSQAPAGKGGCVSLVPLSPAPSTRSGVHVQKFPVGSISGSSAPGPLHPHPSSPRGRI